MTVYDERWAKDKWTTKWRSLGDVHLPQVEGSDSDINPSQLWAIVQQPVPIFNKCPYYRMNQVNWFLQKKVIFQNAKTETYLGPYHPYPIMAWPFPSPGLLPPSVWPTPGRCSAGRDPRKGFEGAWWCCQTSPPEVLGLRPTTLRKSDSWMKTLKWRSF